MSVSVEYCDGRAGVPLNELCSVATALVWRSHGGEVTRILYPGSAPQSELIKSIEQLRELEVFKYPNGSKTGPKVTTVLHTSASHASHTLLLRVICV